jgi:glycosyltransferase involved in cell wall biosynthesis
MTTYQTFNFRSAFDVINAGNHAQTLNIAIVSETWPPEINGVAMSVLQLAKGLQQLGHRILLVRPDQKASSPAFEPDALCLVKAQALPKYPDLRFGWPQMLKIGRSFDQFKPDIVHIVTEGPLGLAALNVAKQRNYPVSSGFHSPFHEFSRFFDLAFLVKPVQSYLRWFHNQTDLTCVPSVDTQQALIDFGVKCKLAVVSRGVDNSLFHPSKRDEALRQSWDASNDTTVVLYVGRVSPEKNIDLSIKAFRAAQKAQPNRDFKLVIVGDGPDRARLEKLAPDAVFAGMQTGENLARHYASGDVFLFGSEIETFGNVVLEALSSGVPVLAYDYACAALVMQHGHHGWCVPFGEADQFVAQAMDLPEKSVLRNMGEKATQRAGQFAWQLAIQQFDQALTAPLPAPDAMLP